MGTELPERDGYEDPYRYPVSKIKTHGVGFVVAVVFFILLRDQLSPLLENGLALYVVGVIIIGAISNTINTEFHEGIHERVGSLLGYEPRKWIPWHRQIGRVDFPGQFVDPNHNIISLLSPLTFLSFIYGVILLADIYWAITLPVAIMFIMNAAGSGADIYGAYFDYKLPDGSLVYFVEDEGESYIYEPVG